MASTFDNHQDRSPDQARRSDLRIGDAERERVAALISDAAAAGYLDLTELDDRLETVLSARTAGELAQATADLPPEWLREREPPRPAPQRPHQTRPAQQSHQQVRRSMCGAGSRDFKSSLRGYVVGMAVMVSIWLAVGIAEGAWYPWVIWPALGWGISVVAHAGRRSVTRV